MHREGNTHHRHCYILDIAYFGVELFILCMGIFQNLGTDKRMTPHFLYVITPAGVKGSTKNGNMNKTNYLPPLLEVLNIEMEQSVLTGSGAENSTGNTETLYWEDYEW